MLLTLLSGLILVHGAHAAEEEPGGEPKSEEEPTGGEDPDESGEDSSDKDAPKSDDGAGDGPPVLEEGSYEEIEASESLPALEEPPASEDPAPPSEMPPLEEAPPVGGEPAPESSEPAGSEPREEADEEPAAAQEEEPATKRPFIKGELLDVGELDLLGMRSRAGARVGYRAISHVHYATVEPGVDLRISKFRLGVSAPLNIEIWDGSEGLVSLDVGTGKEPKPKIQGFDNAGTIRGEDWDHWRDYFRLLRYASWGRKEDNFHISVSQAKAGSIGHGTIMKRYLPQVDLDSVRLGAQFDTYADWLGGFEFYTNDITNWNMLGVLGFIKPLAPFMEHYLPRSLSIGVSFATDFHAPRRLLTETITSNVLDTTTGQYLSWDVITLDTAVNETLPEVDRTARVYIWGIDTELKVVKTETTDIKLYVDYSSMIDAGSGFTGGALFRLNFGDESIHALRLRGEVRYFTGNYRPAYFDSFYEIDKWQYLTGSNRYAGNGDPPRTKYDAITSSDSDGHFGYFLEFGYSLVDKISFGGSLEGHTPDEQYNLMLSLSVPWLDYLRIAGTYQKRHFSDFSTVFGFQDNDWLTALVRIKILPVLYVNGQAGYLWRLNREKIGAGADRGLPGRDYGLYQGHWDLRAWLDIAYEFEI